jgi:rhodanese-related sulfurtransferase
MAHYGNRGLLIVALLGVQACSGNSANTSAVTITGGASTAGVGTTLGGTVATSGSGGANQVGAGGGVAGSTAIGNGGSAATGGATGSQSAGDQATTGGASFSANNAAGGQATGGQVAAGGTTSSAGGSAGCGGTATLGTVSPADLYAELQASQTFLLIDVRTPPVDSEIQGTYANIAYTDVAAIETLIGTDKSTPVVLYCKTGHTSQTAGTQLEADGYCQVRYLEGGIDGWIAAGYPTS